jgi:hypothetical protein
MSDKQIKNLIKQFMNERKAGHRYASFDYCFNYFRRFKSTGRLKDLANKENLEKSCLQLGFFLASWGMFRMSGKLGQEANAKHFEKLIREISLWQESHKLARIWDVDAANYGEKATRDLLVEGYKRIKRLVKPARQKSHRALVTKIMLGMFGCVPALDSFFVSTFKTYELDDPALQRIYEFYRAHSDAIQAEGKKATMFDFSSGKLTGEHYTDAKIIDMIGFQKGKNKAAAKKRKNKARVQA